MKIQREKKSKFDFSESGALSDLAFLLIVFFIVIAVFNINQGFVISLPRKDSTRFVNTEDLVQINVQKDGTLLANGEEVDRDSLKVLIRNQLAAHPNTTVLVKIHPDALYQEVVKVVDIIRRLNVENFSFSQMEGSA
jgi:biopolymer transport protein ExbD